MASNKLPAFQWYVGDWRKDPGVQALDYFCRGVWLEILMLMHESDERGVLLLNRKPMPDDALARLLGLDKQKITEVITTLLSYGVASRDNRGALINRRMVRDEVLRQARKQAGERGGNPNFAKGKKNPYYRDNQKDNQKDKQKITPSTSTSSSSSNICIYTGGKIKHGSYVWLSEIEFDQYLVSVGSKKLSRAIEKLNGWIGKDPADPQKIFAGQNASATFQNWVFLAVEEEFARAEKRKNKSFVKPSTFDLNRELIEELKNEPTRKN